MEYFAIVETNSISHHGTKGQKWGLRRAEWYPIDKYREHLQSLGYDEKTIKKKMKKAEKGEIKYKREVAKNKAKNLAKAQAKRKANLEIKRQEDAKQKEKEDIIKKGDINAALKRLDDFSNEELDAIRNRNKAKEAVINAKMNSVINKMGTVADASHKLMNIASDSVNTYNTIAKVANTFGDKEWKIIGQNNNQQINKTVVEDNTQNKRTTVITKDGEKKSTIDFINKPKETNIASNSDNQNKNPNIVKENHSKPKSYRLINKTTESILNKAADGIANKVMEEGVKAFEKDGKLSGNNTREKFENGAVREIVKSATSQGAKNDKVNELKSRIRSASTSGSMNNKMSNYMTESNIIGKNLSSGKISEAEYKSLINMLKDKYNFD